MSIFNTFFQTNFTKKAWSLKDFRNLSVFKVVTFELKLSARVRNSPKLRLLTPAALELVRFLGFWLTNFSLSFFCLKSEFDQKFPKSSQLMRRKIGSKSERNLKRAGTGAHRMTRKVFAGTLNAPEF